METEPGQSGIRQCYVCGKFCSQSDLKDNSCRKCWKWFWFNCDEYFHKESKNICSHNCETVGMLLSCNSCRLKKFLEITQYRCEQRQCSSCGCKTVINGKNPQCSCCRVLSTKKCTCKVTTTPCSWCVSKTSNKNNNDIDVESLVANEKPCLEFQSTSALLLKSTTAPSMLESRTNSLVVDMTEDCETPHATINIDLSLLPQNLQAKAKAQVLGTCYVRICDLSSRIIKSSRKETEEQKVKKRPRNDSLKRNEDSVATAKISSQGDHGRLHKEKAPKVRESPDYNVMKVSDTRLILRLGTEHHVTDVDSHVGISHHVDSCLTNKEKAPFPRKNPLVKPKFPVARRDFVSSHGSKSQSKVNEDAAWRATVDKATQTEHLLEIECLQRRINELELIIASSRSRHTPSPPGGSLPQKSPSDPTLTLSTPPSSDSGINAKNQTPTKSPCVLVNRLTKDVLEHYGVNRNSSVSPTEEPRPKKRPRLDSADSDHLSFKKSDRKAGGTSKVLELFGNDSEEDVPAIKDGLGTSKTQPFDFDGLDYDDDEDEEFRPNNNYSIENQQINKHVKTNGIERHDKSSKSEKKEKNSEKNKRNEKGRKKKEDQKSKDIPKSSKTLKEKVGDKEITRPRKDQTAVGNSSKFRIPKLAAPTTVGLPSLLQENLEQAKKIHTSSAAEEPALSRTPEPEPFKNLTAKPNELPKVSSNIDNTTELPLSTSSFQVNGKTAAPILCILPKARNNKSVNFPEQIATIRSISPRSQLHELEQTPEDPSSRENYIPTILEDLHYVPESSPREPVKGIRPFHPPVCKIDREKLKSLPQERGGRRFIYSSSSSSSSENESSENESEQEAHSNTNFNNSTRQTPSSTAVISPVESQSIANGSAAIQRNGNDLGMNYIVHGTTERTSLSSTGSISSDTLSTNVKCISTITALAVTNDSTRDISCVSMSEEHVQSISPEKSFLPSLAVPTSPRHHNPEPRLQASPVDDTVNEIQNFEDDDSEDEDVLDIGLNDEEIFDYGYDEVDQLREPLPTKPPAAKIISESARSAYENGVQPSPITTVTTSNRIIVPAAQVKPSVILRSTVPAALHPPPLRDEQTNNRGVCHEFIRKGKCLVSDWPNKKCGFNHNLDLVLDHFQSLCNKKNIQMAARLVFSMTNVESPLNKSLYQPMGLQIVGTVISAIMMESRPEQIIVALEMLNHPKLPMVTECIDKVIQQTPGIPANANQLVALYERCQQNNIKMSPQSFHKIIEVLVNNRTLKGWDFIFNAVECAIKQHRQLYDPTVEVLNVLFCMAFDQPKLERVCRLFSHIGPRALLALGPQGRREVLNRLREFSLVEWYDRYSGIRHPINNEMHSQIVTSQYPPNGMINHDPALSLHRAQHSLLQANQFQQPFRPPLHNSRPQIPTLQPPGLRPSIPAMPSAAFHRPPPPTIPPVSLHRTQPLPIRMNPSVVNSSHPSAPGANTIRNPAENVIRTMSNGIAPTPQESLIPLIPPSPTSVAPLAEINQSAAFIPLQVPKPSHSLDLNLFEPESPEVEPVFVDSEPEQGPSIVVVPSYGIEDELLAEFKEMNFEAVTRLFLQYYSGNRRCPMLASLVRIMKTNPLYGPKGDKELSPGEIFIKIIDCACKRGNATTLEHRHQQAFLDLFFFVLLHFLQLSNTNDNEERINQLEIAKEFLKMVMLYELPLDDFIKHPELLVFVAECFLQVDFSKEEEEEGAEGVVEDICQSIIFLTEFHDLVTKTPSNSFSSTLVKKDLELADLVMQLITTLHGYPEFQPYLNRIAGVMDYYNSACMKNKSRFQAILKSQE